MDASNTYSTASAMVPGRSQLQLMDTATVERMLQAASFGAQMLEAAVTMQHPLPASPVPRSFSPKPKMPASEEIQQEAPNTDVNGSSSNASSGPKHPVRKNRVDFWSRADAAPLS